MGEEDSARHRPKVSDAKLSIKPAQPIASAATKSYGYKNNNVKHEDPLPQRLAEVILCATRVEFHRIAEFLAICTVEVERMGDTYDHLHLDDRMAKRRSMPCLKYPAKEHPCNLNMFQAFKFLTLRI